MSLGRAVFLDRDGVLNQPVVRDGKPYPPMSIDEFVLYPDAAVALGQLRAAGFALYVVTNQPDVARGAQQRSVVERMNAILKEKLPLDEVYVCYHDDSDACPCRKPKPGLLLQAAAEHGLSLSASFMIGDRWRDIDCGRAAGCRTVFLDRSYSESLRMQPDFTTTGLALAADIVASQHD